MAVFGPNLAREDISPHSGWRPSWLTATQLKSRGRIVCTDCSVARQNRSWLQGDHEEVEKVEFARRGALRAFVPIGT